MTPGLEVRRQHGGFRQGYFGPDYELAEAPFPDGFYVLDIEADSWRQKHVKTRRLFAAVYSGWRQRLEAHAALPLHESTVWHQRVEVRRHMQGPTSPGHTLRARARQRGWNDARFAGRLAVA